MNIPDIVNASSALGEKMIEEKLTLVPLTKEVIYLNN
jgi:hypothetical protein